MDHPDNAASGQVEWLDLGPADRRVGAGPQHPRPLRWYALALAVAAVAGGLLAYVQHSTNARTATPSHALATAGGRSGAAPSADTSSSAPAVAVTALGHRLLDAPAGWELFAAGRGEVVRIEIASGRVTRTTVPPLDNGGGIAMLAGPDRVIVTPVDDGDGFEVRDGRPPRLLPITLANHGAALPGPDKDHVWVSDHTGPSVMNLVGFDGQPTGTSIPIPDGGSVTSDSAGYLLLHATGGVYDVRPGQIHRITTGELLAAGPTRWLTLECDAHYRCVITVIDRASGARRVLRTPAHTFRFEEEGVIAPDGSTAAYVQIGRSGRPELHLLDLSTGADHLADVTFSGEFLFGGGRFVWSPDSHWLFVTGPEGRAVVLDRRTMHAANLGVTIPPDSRLALRTDTR
ncbi:MAG: hypothetical protein DLM57_13410 [Pseudonocardiales bacterium]|nr:MAG: hypothetical protein DLM57_13410 [Pseudonocardiales bacterium]